MNNYYEEIEHIIKRNEINKKTRQLEDNYDALNTYWNIGRLIVEAQGGESRAKYGNNLIKEWSTKLSKLYGNGYDYTNLSRFRKFYLIFPKLGPMGQQLIWSHIRYILPIKDENERNYYINLCIKRNLSKNKLIEFIKSKSYQRLLDKPKKIEIISNSSLEKIYNIRENIKNSIIVIIESGKENLKEKELKLEILAKLRNIFEELGDGYAFIGLEYKIKIKNITRYIDLLLFNVEMNSYVVVEVKTRELQERDKGQILMYMNMVDLTLKRSFHNKTIGIVISKYQDKFIATFVSEEDIIPITYQLQKEKTVFE